MVQFLSTGMCEAEHLAPLGIDTGHDVPDGAVLAGRVHRLKNKQQRIAVVRVVESLQFAEFLNVFVESLLVLFLRCVERLHPGWPLVEIDRCAFRHLEIVGLNVHGRLSSWFDARSTFFPLRGGWWLSRCPSRSI